MKNIVFPTVVAGDDDRASFAYLGTTTAGSYQDPAFAGVWHLYVSTTYDGGRTWGTVDVTPTDPVQRGSICTGGTTCGKDRNLLDFIDVTADSHGRVLVGYADGCTGACATGGVQNFDALASIARQSRGLTLRAAYDPKPNLVVSALTTTAGPNRTYSATAVMKNVGPASASGAAVRVLLDGRTVTTSSSGTLAAGASRTVTVRLGTVAKGSHTVLAVADPTAVVAESVESDNRRSVALTVR